MEIQKSCFSADDEHSTNIFRRREFFSTAQKKSKTSLGRLDRFRPGIVQIGSILTIFKPFEILKFYTPLFGEFAPGFGRI